jgi:SSS family solute:Na+ symporter
MLINIIVLAVFGLVILWISVYGYRVSAKTAEDYMLAGRGIGLIVMFFFILFGISSAWTFYGYPGFLYRHGPSFVYFIWGAIAGFISLYMFIGPRLWAISKLNHFISPVEVIAERYESKSLRVIVSFVLLVALVPYIAVELLGVGIGFKALTNLPVWIGILYTMILLIIIVILGGMRTTAWGNVLFGTIYTLVFLGALVWVVRLLFPGGLAQAVKIIADKNPLLLAAPGPVVPHEPSLGYVFIVGFFFAGLLAFAWPHIVVGSLTARDKFTFKWMPLLGILAGGLGFYTIPFIWGAIAAPAAALIGKAPLVTGKAADNIVQVIANQNLPHWFGVFMVLGVICAAVSTASVQLLLAAILVSRDLIHSIFKPDATDRQLVLWTKFGVLGLLALSLLIALWNPTALALYLTSIAVPGFAQWAPALVGTIVWPRATKQGALAGIIPGTALVIAGFIFRIDNMIIPALLVNVLLYVVVSLATRRPSEEIKRRFYDEVDEYLSAKE